MSLYTDDAMAEVVPLTPAQDAHLGRLTSAIVAHTQTKFCAGQREHGGNLHEKPGMLAHAFDEATDLSVYLLTLREQMLALAHKCKHGDTTLLEAADEIERWLAK